MVQPGKFLFPTILSPHLSTLQKPCLIIVKLVHLVVSLFSRPFLALLEWRLGEDLEVSKRRDRVLEGEPFLESWRCHKNDLGFMAADVRNWGGSQRHVRSRRDGCCNGNYKVVEIG